MKLKFNDKNELYTFLETSDLIGLDSEYSLSTQKLKKKCNSDSDVISKYKYKYYISKSKEILDFNSCILDCFNLELKI